jgi:membrane carboxypeptidase/penicillin-binding protein
MDRVSASPATWAWAITAARPTSISLGAGDTTVQADDPRFSTFANHGRSIGPTLIDYVQDRNGKVIYRTDDRCTRMTSCSSPEWDGRAMPRPPLRGRQVVDPLTAYQVVHMLEGVVERGTATILRDLERPLFGKTGTTTGPTNVWFIGGSQDVVAGLYLGFDQPRAMGGHVQGGTVAAPIFRQFAKAAFEGHAGGAVPRAGRHPDGADRPAVRPAGAGQLADRRSARRGDLGSLQAGKRAAPDDRQRRGADRRGGRSRPAAAAAPPPVAPRPPPPHPRRQRSLPCQARG